PVVAGATVIKVIAAQEARLPIEWGPMALGTVLAFLAGLVAIKTVLDFVRKGRFHFFAIYCFVAGIAGLILL
ncbi:MAG: undecaprenyl-diphosphate phosphatase, partial [Bacteroidetes bacterium]|nr:undecaprenyl-diphosphate phosphatase [Bacteroidota bacterium]